MTIPRLAIHRLSLALLSSLIYFAGVYVLLCLNIIRVSTTVAIVIEFFAYVFIALMDAFYKRAKVTKGASIEVELKIGCKKLTVIAESPERLKICIEE